MLRMEKGIINRKVCDVMKLKDIEDNDLFTWWTLVDKNGNKITSYENKKNEFSSYIGRKETDKEIYEKYKYCEVLSIYDIDIDINFENNYITVKLNNLGDDDCE